MTHSREIGQQLDRGVGANDERPASREDRADQAGVGWDPALLPIGATGAALLVISWLVRGACHGA